MKMKRCVRAASAVGALLITSLLALSASAYEDKVYSGSICKLSDRKTVIDYWISTGNSITMNHWRDWDGLHAGSPGATYTCPLLRDTTGADAIEAVYVELVNDISSDSTSAQRTISCTLYTQVEDEVQETIFDFEHHSTTTAGEVQFNYTNIDTTAGNEGAYALVCSLRSGDVINQITVQER